MPANPLCSAAVTWRLIQTWRIVRPLTDRQHKHPIRRTNRPAALRFGLKRQVRRTTNIGALTLNYGVYIFWVVFLTFPPIALPNSMRYKITHNDKGGGGNNDPIHHSDTNNNSNKNIHHIFGKKNTALTKHQQLFAPRLHCHIFLGHKY